jgi:hypothetical protein
MERKLKRRGPDAPHNDCANDSNDGSGAKLEKLALWR